MSTWDVLLRKAKSLESRLESKIQKYSILAQKFNADFLCDEENPLMETQEEHETHSEIEIELETLSQCLNEMRNCPNSSSFQHHETLIKRYKEILFDYTKEFRDISSTINRKRESVELFKSSKSIPHDEQSQDSAVAKLLRERNSIAASMRSINDVISQAFETRSNLSHQRSSLTGSSSGLSGLVANVPTFNSLIDSIQRKKHRETLIVAALISVLICFTIWWSFLK